MNVILASSSPQKRSLLNKLGLNFTAQPAEIDEKVLKNEDPEAYVRRMALAKAEKVSAANKGALIIAHDMTIHLDHKILGKPTNNQEAVKILKTLSGKSHNVTGAIVLMKDGEALYQGVQTTLVQFKNLADSAIADYVATGEPLDKSAAYAIQGDGGTLVESIEGSYFNVVGIPLTILIRALEKQGLKVQDEVKNTVSLQEKSIKESFPR